MSDEWYYTRDQQQYGPFEFTDLVEMAQQGVISRGDLIWREGMANWQAAETVPGVFNALMQPPPSPPPQVPNHPGQQPPAAASGYVSPFAKQAASMPQPTVPPVQTYDPGHQPDYSVSQAAKARKKSGSGDAWYLSAGCLIRLVLAIIGIIIGIISAIIEGG